MTTSGRQKKLVKGSNEAIMSETGLTPNESLGFSRVDIGNSEIAKAINDLGIKTFVSINGSQNTVIQAKLASGKTRKQSVPSGDILVLILPESENPRKEGVFITTIK